MELSMEVNVDLRIFRVSLFLFPFFFSTISGAAEISHTRTYPPIMFFEESLSAPPPPPFDPPSLLPPLKSPEACNLIEWNFVPFFRSQDYTISPPHSFFASPLMERILTVSITSYSPPFALPNLKHL